MRRQKGYLKMAAGILAGILGIGGSWVHAMAEATDTEVAMGRYLESEMALPDREKEWQVYDLVRMNSGNLRIAVKPLGGEEVISLWDSFDQGETWNLAAEFPKDTEGIYFSDLSLAPDGGGAGSMVLEEDDDFRIQAVLFDGDGTLWEASEAEESIGTYAFSQEGDLVGMTYGGNVFSMDLQSGKPVHTFITSEGVQLGICQKELIILSAGQALRYDLNSKEPLETDQALEQALFTGRESYETVTSFGRPILFAEDGENTLFYCTREGIFAHKMGGSIVEQVLDGNLVSQADPSVELVGMEVLDGVFYLTIRNSTGKFRVWKYTYDPDTVSRPQKLLTIYSLREDEGLRQMISGYRGSHPDIYLDYQIGMSGTDGVTEADALRTLNTEILSGNGPDILVLDGMSVDAYANKDMLADLSGIFDKVQKEDGIMETIAGTWKKGETIPAIPLRFGFVMAAGREEILNQLEDPASLVQLTEQPRLLDWTYAMQIPEMLYYLCAGDWEREDHTIDTEKLSQYVETVKKIYDNCIGQETEEIRQVVAEQEEEMLSYFKTMTCFGDLKSAGMNLLRGTYGLELGVLLDMTSFFTITSAQDALGEDSLKLLENGDRGVFFPICNMGILNNGENQEEAEEFMTYLLSAEGQSKNDFDGFPVNRAAFQLVLHERLSEDTVMSISSENAETGELLELVCLWPNEEQLDWLAQVTENLGIRAESEQVQMNVVTGEMRRCLRGEISEEEAVNSILQKLNLYLVERGIG